VLLDELMTVTDNNFATEVLQATTPVVVFFTAEGCTDCHIGEIYVDRAAEDYRDDAKFFWIDFDHSPEITKKYGVESAPTVLIFRGGNIIAKYVEIEHINRIIWPQNVLWL
jgi:thioredoxin 1